MGLEEEISLLAEGAVCVCVDPGRLPGSGGTEQSPEVWLAFGNGRGWTLLCPLLGPSTPEKPRPCLTTTAESLHVQFPPLRPSGPRTVFTQINPGSRMVKTNLTHHLVRALF